MAQEHDTEAQTKFSPPFSPQLSMAHLTSSPRSLPRLLGPQSPVLPGKNKFNRLGTVAALPSQRSLCAPRPAAHAPAARTRAQASPAARTRTSVIRVVAAREQLIASGKRYPRTVFEYPGYLRLPTRIQTGTQSSTPTNFSEGAYFSRGHELSPCEHANTAVKPRSAESESGTHFIL